MIGRMVGVIAVLAVCGCASTPEPAPNSDESLTPKTVERVPVERRKVTTSLDPMPLGRAVRSVASAGSTGIVVMNGLENESVGPFEFNETPIEDVIRALAEAAESVYTLAGGYYFIHPERYAMLNRVTLADELDDRYDGLTADVAFSAGTRFYNVFAVLSEALDVTILADHSVAATECGELALRGESLGHALEAVLKSARVHRRAIGIASTDEYIFFYRANNAPRSDLFANREEFGDQGPASLQRKVDVTLPKANPNPGQFPAYESASRLGDVLDTLSAQLGINVRLGQQGLETLPVNPTVMRNVRVETALELLILQWLVPEFVFEFNNDTIVIRHDESGRSAFEQ